MRLSQFTVRIFFIAFCILGLQNILYFSRHYFHGITFPDDFLLTYHAVPYYWIEAFKAGQSIDWVPFQGMGYPLFLNLQSGANYPPFWLFPLFDGTYTLFAAVVMQGLHVFLGGIGACVCARLLGLGWPESILAGIFYQSFGGFYSNSQHPDIIRAYAFIPWLCGPALANWRTRSTALTISLSALPIWVFCLWTGGYPGTAISSLFVLSTVCSLRICFGGRDTVTTGLQFLIMLCVGTLLAGVALVPAALSSTELDRAGDFSAIVYDYMNVRDFFALAFPVSNSYFTHDISMRSLFVGFPVIALVLIGLVKRDARLTWPLVCAFIALMMALGPLHHIASTMLPPLRLSRFVMADNRAIICLVLTLAAACFAGGLRRVSKFQRLWPLLLILFFWVGGALLNLERDYADEDRIALIMAAIVCVAAVLDDCTIRYRSLKIEPVFVLALVVLVFYVRYLRDVSVSSNMSIIITYIFCVTISVIVINFISGLIFKRSVHPTIIISLAIFASFFVSFIFFESVDKNGILIPISICVVLTIFVLSPSVLQKNQVIVISALAMITVMHWIVVNWPERYFAPPMQDGVEWVESITGKFSVTQNLLQQRLISGKCRGPRYDTIVPTANQFPWSGYYTGEYFMRDYSGPMKLKRQQKILSSEPLRSFAMLPWTMIEVRDFEGGLGLSPSESPRVNAVCVKYGTSEVRYLLNLSEPTMVVENETYSPGWFATLFCENCGWEANTRKLMPLEVDGFRGWALPSGQYLFVARFETPNLSLGIAASLLGLGLWVAAGWSFTERNLPGGGASQRLRSIRVEWNLAALWRQFRLTRADLQNPKSVISRVGRKVACFCRS